MACGDGVVWPKRLTAVVTATTLLAACGNDDGDGAAPRSTTTAPSTTTSIEGEPNEPTMEAVGRRPAGGDPHRLTCTAEGHSADRLSSSSSLQKPGWGLSRKPPLA